MADATYTPPAVWSADTVSGGRFANINRPTAGARDEIEHALTGRSHHGRCVITTAASLQQRGARTQGARQQQGSSMDLHGCLFLQWGC